MKKIFFLTYGVNLENHADGLCKKVYAQVSAFEAKGYEVHLSGTMGDKYYINGQIYNLRNKNIFEAQRDLIKLLCEFLKGKSYDLMYIRKFYFTANIIGFLRFIRGFFKHIVLELPTYPYYGELVTFRSKIGYWIEYLCVSKKLKNFIDNIVTFSEDEKIYNINCIKITNGISENQIINKFNNYDDRLIFISVSSITYWHGLDRFIKSMIQYSDLNIQLHIFGPDNSLCKDLRQLCNDGGISDKVIFHGYKSGIYLDQVYSQSTIGLGSLGRHRSKIYNLNSLKNREYIAKGLPVVYSENDNEIDSEVFVYKVSADESIVNLEEIFEWYKDNKFNKKDISKKAYDFVWEKQIEKILVNLGLM